MRLGVGLAPQGLSHQVRVRLRVRVGVGPRVRARVRVRVDWRERGHLVLVVYVLRRRQGLVPGIRLGLWARIRVRVR